MGFDSIGGLTMKGKFRFGVFVVFVAVVFFFFLFYFFSGVSRAQTPAVPQYSLAYANVRQDSAINVVYDVAVLNALVDPAKVDGVPAKADANLSVGQGYTVDYQNVAAQKNKTNAVWGGKQANKVYKYVQTRVYYSGDRRVASEVSLKNSSLKAYVKNVEEYGYEGNVIDNYLVREIAKVYVGGYEDYKESGYYQS
jgi:hypothetical protein